MPFVEELYMVEDIEIDSFTLDGTPMPFGCAISSITLPKEFMMQHAENDVIEI